MRKKKPEGKKIYTLKAEPGEFKITGGDAELRVLRSAATWTRFTFKEKAAALQRGEEPLELHKAIRERWPSMSDDERLVSLNELEVPRDLWLALVQGEPSPLQQRAAELFALVNPPGVVIFRVPPKGEPVGPKGGLSYSNLTLSELSDTLPEITDSVSLELLESSGQFFPLTVTQEPELIVKKVIVPALPDKLKGELLSVPNAQAYHDTRKALAQPKYFERTDEPWPTARFPHANSSTKVQMKPPNTENSIMPLDVEVSLAKSMWKQHEALSDTDADTLDALMAIYLARNPTPGSDVAAHVDQLLELRGVQRKKSGSGRRGGFHATLRNEALASVFRLESLWIEFDGPIVKQRGKPPERDVIFSRVITVSDVHGQRRLDNGRLDAMSFEYRPGKTFARFLNTEGGRQTALLSAKALKYNSKYYAIEKRLARYFAYIWRVRASASDFYTPFTIETLLIEAGIEIDKKKPKRTKDRLDAALARLEDDGVIAAQEYSSDVDTSRYGWPDEWRKASIKIEAPDSIRSHLRSIDRRQRLEIEAGSLGSRFAQARKAAGKTQAYCADRLDIAPQKLDAIETGQQKLTPSLTRRLEAELKLLLTEN